MNDPFITAINTQKATMDWMSLVTKNMVNLYTPGYKEAQGNFKTFLDGTDLDDTLSKMDQGKSFPGTSPENVFLEGQGFFVTKNSEGRTSYTRLGEFKFDGEGVYKTNDGRTVQGYILNDKGEVLSGAQAINKDPYTNTLDNGGPASVATTEIKMWIDPNNGKYMGKYDEYEIKGDGIIYGKADKGKIQVPLYKIAVMNFHNPQGLTEISQGEYIENDSSGKPVSGKGEIRSGLIELSNTDFKANIQHYQEAKMQLEMTNKLISSSKTLLEDAMRLLGN